MPSGPVTTARPAGDAAVSGRRLTIVVDPAACDGYGTCAELFPERIAADPWGYPLVTGVEIAPAHLQHARRAVASCPRQALHLVERDDVLRGPTG